MKENISGEISRRKLIVDSVTGAGLAVASVVMSSRVLSGSEETVSPNPKAVDGADKDYNEPLVNKVAQVALVVKNAEATAKKYWDELGVGPWYFYTINSSNSNNTEFHGQGIDGAFRAALADISGVQWELIEPLDNKGVYAEFLARHGEGLHHVAFGSDNLLQLEARLKKNGHKVIQSGELFESSRYSYLDTNKTLGCITEFGEMLPGGKEFPEPEYSYPSTI